MNLKLIISDAVYFFRSNLVQISSLCLPWLLAVAVVNYIITAAGDQAEGILPLYLLVWGFNLLVYPIYTGALILLMSKRAQQKQPENKALLASAMRIWQPFFILHLMVAGLTAVGLAFLILPGVIVAVSLSFAEFFLVVEGVKPLDALQKSFHATRPFFFQILMLMVMFLTPLWLLNLIVANFLATQDVGPLINIIVTAISAFFMLFVDVVRFRLYMSAKLDNPV
jgi:hypothetical protein